MGDGIQVTLGGDWRGFSEMLKKADAATVNFGKDFIGHIKGTMGAAFGAAALEEWVRGSIRAAGRINDLADQFQITRQEVQLLDKVTMDTGQTMDDFGSILLRIAAARKAAALNPGGAESAAFENRGVSRSMLLSPNASTFDIIQQISRGLESAGKATPEILADLQELGGKTGPKVYEAMKRINEEAGKKHITFLDDKSLDDLEQAEKLVNSIYKIIGNAPAISIAAMKGIGESWRPDRWAKGLWDRARGIKPPPEPGDPDFIGPMPEDDAVKNMRERRKLWDKERRKMWDAQLGKAGAAQAGVEDKIGAALLPGMTPAEQKAALMKRAQDMMTDAMEEQLFGSDIEGSQKLLGEAAGVAGQLGGLQLGKAWSWAPKLSQNQAIGAYSAASPSSNPAITAQKEATAILKQIADFSRQLLQVARDDKFQ